MALTTWPAKAPTEVKTYSVVWTTTLDGDTISTSTFALISAAGLTKDSESNTDDTATVKLSGGTAGEVAQLRNTITTAAGLTLVEDIDLPILATDAALVVEDGSGVVGADCYASVAYMNAYWAARPHSTFYAAWQAASLAKRAGAGREATAYLDATWGAHYKGVRAGYVQGRLWPRTDASDEAGYPLPALPEELKRACAELAGRAVSAALAADIDPAAKVKRDKIGPLETEYFESPDPAPKTSYGAINDMLAPILAGTQPGAPVKPWAWA